MAQTGCDGHHRRRFDHRRPPQKGVLRHARPHRRAETRRVQRSNPRHHHDDARRAPGDRPRQQERDQVQKHVRTGYLLLPVRPAGGLRIQIHRNQIRKEEPRHSRSQQAGHPGGIQLRSQYAPVRKHLYRSARTARKGHLPLDQRQRRHGMGTVRRSRKGRVAALLRLVPDHSGHRNPRRAGQAQRPRAPACRSRARRWDWP